LTVIYWYVWIYAELYKDVVSGLDGIMFSDLMESIEWFFNLHDKDKDGYLSKDEVLTLSESLLVSNSDRLLDLTVSETVPSSSSASKSATPTSVQLVDS